MYGFNKHGARGFTLVELAVVVAVIALLLGSLLVPLTTQVEQRNTSAAQKQLDEVREALIGFALVEGRLPRPATSLTDGREAPECGSVQACTGYLPWTTLGVSKTDPWGKMFRYSVVPEFAAQTTKFSFSTSPAGGYKTVVATTGAGVPLAEDLVAVVLSYSGRNWGTTTDGQALGDDSTTNVDEDTNNTRFSSCDGAGIPCTGFVARAPANNTSAAGGEFDDLLVWVPRSILFSRMVQAGRLP
jgi:prepilin-type N-terminal cleavage/methylation domain-containing protein